MFFENENKEMKKRAMGIETEYGTVFKKMSGECSSLNAAERILFYIWQLRFSKFKNLIIYGQDSSDMWLGSNGSRIYNDLYHIEYSSPECASADDVVKYNFAGDRILNEARDSFRKSRFFSRWLKEYKEILITKNNSDFLRPNTDLYTNFDSSEAVHFFGTHENYLTKKRLIPANAYSLEDNLFLRMFMPFIVSRVVIHGAGGLWYTPEKKWHYVISPRAFIINYVYGADTTIYRPLVQFAEARTTERVTTSPSKVRLHLILGDSNMSSTSVYLNFGTTHLVLRLIEEMGGKIRLPKIENPLEALHQFSSDLNLRSEADFDGGIKLKATDIQKYYIDAALKLDLCEWEKRVLSKWISIVKKLEEGWESVARELDWATKYSFLNESMAKKSFDLQNEKARLIDLLYSDISDKGIYNGLKKIGGVDVLFTDEEISKAVFSPPPDTRAILRSDYIKTVWKIKKDEPLWDNLSVYWHQYHKRPSVTVFDPLQNKSVKAEELLRKINKKIKNSHV